ncbi:cysteine-rich DPF motif domain-containing protein 1-like [Lytechinus variegatus]|uniref:cysteine-rich DPF motif domain-containing protein 1-like n=1 Tax=Lytechinus variegatus TaxID=7654 RepID=UPI001BB0E7B1|nr:cysteine-rich DPF motif domain-containing protein 1-like [Lytechinus variegatus]
MDGEQDQGGKRRVFACSSCQFSSPYDYYGKRPGFLKSIVLLEEAYVMKDPFTPENRHLTIGGHCSECNKPVCVNKDCSIFYTRRFCLDCVLENFQEFPKEVQQEVNKKDNG